MAKLINLEQIKKNNIGNYLTDIETKYSKYLEGGPTFATYFSQDKVNSLSDKGLTNTVQITGPDSPKKYNKIQHFTLYGIGNISPSISIGDFGPDTEYAGDAVIIPETLRPLVDDFFMIEYAAVTHMFKINNVVTDRIKGKLYYKIEFALAHETVIQDSEITDNYKMYYDELGTENNVVLIRSDYFLVEAIDILYDSIMNFFVSYFYNNYFNIFSFKHIYLVDGVRTDLDIYDEEMTIFMYKNKLTEKLKKFYKEIYIEPLIKTSADGNYELYEHSIYRAMELKSYSNLSFEDFFLTEMRNTELPYYGNYRKFYRCNRAFVDIERRFNINEYIYPVPSASNDIVTFKETFLLKSEKNIFIKPFNSELNTKIVNNTVYDTDVSHPMLENIIIKYINKDLEIDDDLFQSLDAYNYSPCLKDFLLVPLVVYILLEKRKNIFTKNILS